MALPSLSHFSLAGGTGLALQLGHRRSFDLDLFTHKEFIPKELGRLLSDHVKFSITQEAVNTLSISSDNVLVDFIRYDYPIIKPIVTEDHIRLYSKEDIACMKLSAIASRGSKRDFYDLYFLIREFTLSGLLSSYEAKYGIKDHCHLLKSLVYFEDADPEPEPVMLKEVSWVSVKESLKASARNLLS
jgi:hypothetical protein